MSAAQLLLLFITDVEYVSDMDKCCAAELPLEFPDGTTPVMSRICIYDSAVGGGTGVGSPLKIASPPQLPTGSLYMEEVHAKVRESGW